MLAYDGAADCDFGAAPSVNVSGRCAIVASFNAASTLVDGCLFVLRFNTPGVSCGPFDVITAIEDYGPNPLHDVTFADIPHKFDVAYDDADCGPCVTSTPTATPTNTPPPATATPTNTPPPATATPTNTPRPTFRWGDMNASNNVNALDAALVLRWDAFLIDEFPCCPGIVWPAYPERGDVSDDDILNALDAALILRLDAFLIDYFPADYNQDGFGPEN